ncbi:MAG TPA: hypothetical protein DCY88_24820 [Cyanobacteria bacterium UBA11372]|nr:hypothetical protein [Cyanobacteria bacterium UBA11372]
MLSYAVLFDLDGTLTDPKPGITRCIQYALSELGHPPPNADELHWCIGPPLKGSFSQLLKTSNDRVIEQALSLYRRRYSTIGLFENSLYPEITATLKTIRSAGYKTFVATSKPHIYATRILEHFNILSLFDGVYGSTTFSFYQTEVLGSLVQKYFKFLISFTFIYFPGVGKYKLTLGV